MPKPRKSTEDSFYDVFGSWPLTEQKIVVRVLERLVSEREKDEKRAAKPPVKVPPNQNASTTTGGSEAPAQGGNNSSQA